MARSLDEKSTPTTLCIALHVALFAIVFVNLLLLRTVTACFMMKRNRSWRYVCWLSSRKYHGAVPLPPCDLGGCDDAHDDPNLGLHQPGEGPLRAQLEATATPPRHRR